MLLEKINLRACIFTFAIFSVCLFNFHTLQAHETHHSKTHAKIKSDRRSSKQAKIKGRSTAPMRTTSCAKLKSMHHVKHHATINGLNSAIKSKKLPAIHFGPGPSGRLHQAIHFGPGPGGRLNQAIHFGPGPGGRINKAIHFGPGPMMKAPTIYFGPGPDKKAWIRSLLPYTIRHQQTK